MANPISSLASPYQLASSAQILTFTGSPDTPGIFDIPLVNLLPLQDEDYNAGSVRFLHIVTIDYIISPEARVSFVRDNPDRTLLGTVNYTRDGRVVSGSKRQIEYSSEEIRLYSCEYKLSRQKSSEPIKLRLAQKADLRLTNQADLAVTYGSGNLTGNMQGVCGGGGGILRLNSVPDPTWAQTIGGEFSGQISLPGLSLLGKVEQGTIDMRTYESQIDLNELAYPHDWITGELNCFLEPDKVQLFLYAGISANIDYRVYKCGILEVQELLPTLPPLNPPPGGGGGGGGGGTVP